MHTLKSQKEYITTECQKTLVQQLNYKKCYSSLTEFMGRGNKPNYSV